MVTWTYEGGDECRLPTLRERAAVAALSGVLATYTGDVPLPNPEDAAEQAVRYADALVAALAGHRLAEAGDICPGCATIGIPGALCPAHAAAGIPAAKEPAR